jgi:hypothetical protein
MRITLAVLVLAAVACGRTDETEMADSAAAAPAAMPAGVNLADLAGTWNAQVRAEGSDSVLVTYTMNATADPSGWTITLPGRDPMPVRVTTDGDSIMTFVGPYESVLRPGVQVTTDGVMRVMDGRLVGTTIARYTGPTVGADSVVRLRSEATRAP